MTADRSLPHLTHAFPLGDGGELRLTVQQPGDPVEVTIGEATVLLPPGLSIAFGNALAGAGKSSYQSKRAIERRIEAAERAQDCGREPGLRIEGDARAVTDQARPLLPCAWELLPITSSGKCELCGESWQAGSSRPSVCRAAPEAVADDDAVAFRQHRLAGAASDAEGC